MIVLLDKKEKKDGEKERKKERKKEKGKERERERNFQRISAMSYTICHSHSVNTHSLYCILSKRE